MKQTTVEWLEEIASKGFISPEKFEQAKEMEKQQLSKYLDNLSQNINRVEVIQHSRPYNGRAYTNREAKHVEIILQDNNETLKIFLV
jgi:Icc-related predicted phosphoesterase